MADETVVRFVIQEEAPDRPAQSETRPSGPVSSKGDVPPRPDQPSITLSPPKYKNIADAPERSPKGGMYVGDQFIPGGRFANPWGEEKPPIQRTPPFISRERERKPPEDERPPVIQPRPTTRVAEPIVLGGQKVKPEELPDSVRKFLESQGVATGRVGTDEPTQTASRRSRSPAATVPATEMAIKPIPLPVIVTRDDRVSSRQVAASPHQKDDQSLFGQIRQAAAIFRGADIKESVSQAVSQLTALLGAKQQPKSDPVLLKPADRSGMDAHSPSPIDRTIEDLNNWFSDNLVDVIAEGVKRGVNDSNLVVAIRGMRPQPELASPRAPTQGSTTTAGNDVSNATDVVGTLFKLL